MGRSLMSAVGKSRYSISIYDNISGGPDMSGRPIGGRVTPAVNTDFDRKTPPPFFWPRPRPSRDVRLLFIYLFIYLHRHRSCQLCGIEGENRALAKVHRMSKSIHDSERLVQPPHNW